MWTGDGMWNLGHPWLIYPISAVQASKRCRIYPMVFLAPPLDMATRTKTLDHAIKAETRIHELSSDQTQWTSPVSHDECLSQMTVVRTALAQLDCEMPTSSSSLDIAPFDTASEEERWTASEGDLHITQHTWPNYLSGHVPAPSDPPPSRRRHFHPPPYSSSLPTNSPYQMQPRHAGQARRATRKRAKDLYTAWVSEQLPLPPVPPLRESVLSATEQAHAAEEKRDKKLRKAMRRSQNKQARRTGGQAQETVTPSSKPHPQRRSPEVKDLDLIDIWDWYEACIPVIEALVSGRSQGAPWGSGFEWLEDDVIADYVKLDSYMALVEQFSAARRLVQLYGEEFDRVMQKIINPRTVPPMASEHADDSTRHNNGK